MGKYGFLYNGTICTGCRTCQIACKDKNALNPGVIYRHVYTYETGAYPNPGYYHHSATCNHCENPACVAVCPIGAMIIDENDGTVQHDNELCIGCMACKDGCPYSVPQYLEDVGLAGKCDMCKDLIDKGEKPVCVDACLMRALEWGELEAIQAIDPNAVQDISILPNSSITNPSTYIIPRPAALEADFVQKAI